MSRTFCDNRPPHRENCEEIFGIEVEFLRYYLYVYVILLSVAFLTLIERKLLGYIQFRKGSNKLGSIWLLQPFRDAIKLIKKESYYLFKSNYLYYLISPIFILVLNLII